MEGPAPGGLSQGEWLGMRSRFLADAYESPLEKCQNDLQTQGQWLHRFREYDETILWFEHDLFCQINLIYLLDWFSKQSLSKAKLSLVCIGEFPGKPDFRGLGELTGEQLASLFDSHMTEPFDLAARAWKPTARAVGNDCWIRTRRRCRFWARPCVFILCGFPRRGTVWVGLRTPRWS